MAAKTRIKHLTSSGNSAPTILKTGEIGYSYGAGLIGNGGDRLYIGIQGEDSNGIATEIVNIGGQYYTSLMSAQTSAGVISTAQNPDNSTNGFVPILDSDRKVDQWNVDNLRLDGNSITSTNTNGDITIDPAGTGKLVLNNVYINGTDDTLAEFIYDTVGGAVTGGTGITVTNSDVGNTSTISITNQITAGSAGSATQIPVITFNAQGQLTAVTTAAVATELTVDGDTGSQLVDLLDDDLQILGTANEITTAVTKVGTDVKVTIGLPTNVDIAGDLDVATLDVATSAELASAKVEDLTDNRIVLAGTGGELEDDANLTFNGTTFDIGAGNFQVAAASGNTTVAGNLTVQGSTINLGNDTGDTVTVAGNLVVQGTTTTVESTTITLDDPVIALADNTTDAASDGVDRGVSFKWGNGSSVVDGFFGFDIQSERFVFKSDDSGETDSSDENYVAPWGDAQFGGLYAGNVEIGTSNDNTITTSSGDLTISAAGSSVVINDTVDLNGSLDVSGALTLGTDLAVAHGGTGLSSFTANAVFISNGAGTALNFVTGSEGDVIQFNSSGVPIASDIIDGGTY